MVISISLTPGPLNRPASGRAIAQNRKPQNPPRQARGLELVDTANPKETSKKSGKDLTTDYAERPNKKHFRCEMAAARRSLP